MAHQAKAATVVVGLAVLALSCAALSPRPASADELFADMTAGPNDWSGFYIGGQAGYIRADTQYFVAGSGFHNDPDDGGFLGGGHAGYNWQNGDAVVGIVADVNFADLSGRDNSHPAGEPVEFDMDLTASARLKAGVTLGDRILLYATGGIAFAEADHGWTSSIAGVGHFDFDRTHVGITVGGGVEMALNDMVSAFVEYRFTQYGDESWGRVPSPVAGVFAAPHDFSIETHQVQAGLSIHFDSGLGGGP